MMNRVLFLVYVLWLSSCEERPVVKKEYPKINESEIYKIVDIAIEASRIKRSNLDLHPANINEYLSLDVFTKMPSDSLFKKRNALCVLTEDDLDFMAFQQKEKRNFVWDNYRLRFLQNESLPAFFDISLPVFSRDLNHAVVSVEKRQLPMGWYVVYLMQKKNNRWSILYTKHQPYRTYLRQPRKRACPCRWEKTPTEVVDRP